MDLGRHLDEEELERYSLRVTAEPELSRVEDHLLLCASCREQVETHDLYVRSMHQASARLREEPEGDPRWWAMPRFALAVGAACLLAAAILIARKSSPPFAVSLAATRGANMEAHAPEGVPLALQPDVTGLPAASSYKLEMVDRSGQPVWTGTFPGKTVSPIPAGVYFVRLYSPAGELLREYGLQVASQR